MIEADFTAQIRMFQFPTGWNSTMKFFQKRKKKHVSIPNGMEFYNAVLAEKLIEFCRFQFPTGWNSTMKKQVLTKVQDLFQFPTGWNSTEACRVGGTTGWGSFNSQRDGILHFDENTPDLPVAFQFPTGWNSTLSGWAISEGTLCFNSQRDGILQRFAARYNTLLLRFQFPTGWNSTKENIIIPKEFSCSFNSQRDGILPKREIKKRGWSLVSIPNGMEFYQAFYYRCRKAPVSIPNGMEFYDEK